MNKTNTMKKTYYFCTYTSLKRKNNAKKTPTGKKIEAFETRRGIKWTDRGGELNRIWCKNIHPWTDGQKAHFYCRHCSMSAKCRLMVAINGNEH